MAAKPKQKVAILSLGCPRNLVDSESILGRLSLKGYPVTDDIGKADIAIVNTCAFTQEAKAESIEAILDLVELKQEGRLKKIIVAGCLSQRYKDVLPREISQVDAFVGAPSLNHSLKRYPLTPQHFAYLKICEGCINHCSYCAIPRIKGRFTSLDMGSLVHKAQEFDRQGTKELNIIGQDITGYGLDLYRGLKLTELLREIIKKTKNIRWLRLLYLYPARVSDELIDLIKNEPRICKYIDLPVQHINGRILKLMRRRTSGSDILRLIDKIRSRIPGVALRTSIIVGFPSESEKEFAELLKFIEEVRFERLGAFIYSREEGTAAYKFPGQLAHRTKMSRFNAVMSKQQEISKQVNALWLGKTMQVLLDAREKDAYLARSEFDAPEVDGLVYVSSRRELKPGDFLKVKIQDTLEYDLTGEAV